MKLVLSFTLVALVPLAFAGLCFYQPMEEQMCSSPLAFKGEVISVEETKDKVLFDAVTKREYKVKVMEIYRKEATDLKNGDVVEIDAPGQMLSTAIHMSEGEEYFIQGYLEKDDDDKEKDVQTSFCQTRPFSVLTEDELRVIKGDYKCT